MTAYMPLQYLYKFLKATIPSRYSENVNFKIFCASQHNILVLFELLDCKYIFLSDVYICELNFRYTY